MKLADLIDNISDSELIMLVNNTNDPAKWRLGMNDEGVVLHLRRLDDREIMELIRAVSMNQSLWSQKLPGLEGFLDSH